MMEVVLKGIIIGIIVSAPMGPTGVLCVQRALNKGRWHGFVTGLGAVFSDLIYALVAMWGLGIVVNFIELHKISFQIAGSVFLFLFSYLIFKSNPSRILSHKPLSPTPYWKDFISSFFITLSNVGILFFYIVLYARFNFIGISQSTLQNVVGVIAIGIGAILWWFGITSLIHHVRDYFNIRQLRVFNLCLGFLLLLIGIIGLVAGVIEIVS